jgi:integrase
MIQLQWLTGMRPGEVVQLRWVDIDRSEDVWCFRPQTHKLEHFGLKREVWLGPRAQALIRQWLRVDQNQFIFSPRESEAARREEIRQNRKRPLSASQRRRDAKRQRKDRVKSWYTTNNYRQAITRGCIAAEIPIWSPNQLRKATATRVRKAKGLDGAQLVLGHAHASTTEIYTDIDAAKAKAIARELG